MNSPGWRPRACLGSTRMGRGRPHSSSYVPLVAASVSGKDRTTQREGVRTRGLTDRSDGGRVPARREPQHADARRRSPALQEAGGSGPQLRPRDVRVDARRRRDRAAVPQAPAPIAQDGRAAGVGRGRAVRHRAPHPAQRAAQARAGSASCSTLRAGCTAPAWPGSGRCGRRTSSRACATAGSRCTRRSTTPWSTASRRCGWCRARSPPTPTSATCRRPGTPAPGTAKVEHAQERCRARAGRGPGDRRCAPRSASPPRPPACPGALIKTLSKSVRNETSALSLYAPRTIFNQNDHRLPSLRRPGLADRAAARDRQGDRDDDQRRRAGDVRRRGAHATSSSSTRCPTRRWSRWCRSASRPRSRTSPPAEGGNAVGAVMCKLGTDLEDPADRLDAIHHVDDGRQARRCRA